MIVRKLRNGVIVVFSVIPINLSEALYTVRAYELGPTSEYRGHLYYEGKMWGEVSGRRGESARASQEQTGTYIYMAFPELIGKMYSCGTHYEVPQAKIPEGFLKNI